LTGLVGHHGAFPCQLFCGMKGRHKQNGSHYYPALLKPYDYNIAGCNHADVSVEDIHGPNKQDYETKLQYLLNACGPTDYKDCRRDTGICRTSMLLGLPARHRLPVMSTFSGDVMHVATLNLGDLLLPLWRGTFKCDPTDSRLTWDWAVLVDDVWEKHGEDIANCRPFIPGLYDRPPRNIALKISSGYKAKEWQGCFYGLSPTLLHGILPRVYWRNFCKLIRAVRIVHQRSITMDELKWVQQLLDEFYVEYEVLYVRPCIHAFVHLGLEIPRLGPPTLYSAWTIERTIGNLGEEIKQPSNPYKNLSQWALQHCQVNALAAICPALTQTSHNAHGSLDLGNGYIILRARDQSARYYDGIIGDVISNYVMDAEHTIGNDVDHTWCAHIIFWARLCLPNGQIACSAWKEKAKPIEKLRTSHCVKVSS
jgi:hypothetical protein